MLPLLLGPLTGLFTPPAAAEPAAAEPPTLGLCAGATVEEWQAVATAYGLQPVAFVTAAAALETNDPRPLVYCSILAPAAGWELRSRGPDGTIHAVHAPAPTSAAERETVVQYALVVLGTANPAAQAAAVEAARAARTGASGAGPSGTGASTAPPQDAAPAPVAAAASTAAPPLPVAPIAAPPPPVAPIAAPPPPVAPPAPESAPPAVRSVAARRPAPWVGVGPGALYRPTTTPSASIDIAGGVRLAGQYWLGLDATVNPTRTVSAEGDADGLQDFVIALRGAWSPGVRADGSTPAVAPLLGLGGGVSSHAWYHAGEALGATIAPVVAADLGVNVRMLEEKDHLAFVPVARVTMDLGTTQTVGEHAVPVALLPVQFELLVTFRATVP